MNEHVELIVMFENSYANIIKWFLRFMNAGHCSGSNDCVCN